MAKEAEDNIGHYEKFKKNCCFEKVIFFIDFDICFYTLSSIWVLCTYSLLSHLVEFTRNLFFTNKKKNKLSHSNASEEKQRKRDLKHLTREKYRAVES